MTWFVVSVLAFGCGPTGLKSTLIVDVAMTGFEAYPGQSLLIRFVDGTGARLGSNIVAAVPSSGIVDLRQMFSTRSPMRLQFFVDHNANTTWDGEPVLPPSKTSEPAWEQPITLSEAEVLFGQKRIEARAGDARTIMPPDWRTPANAAPE